MKTYEQLKKEMDQILDNTTPEDLAAELAGYGMKFDKPTPKIQAAMDKYDSQEISRKN